MKKLLLASLISGAVLLSACDEKTVDAQQVTLLNEQLQQAQKQAQEQTQSAQNLQVELDKTKQSLEQLKQQLADNNQLKALVPERVTIFHKDENAQKEGESAQPKVSFTVYGQQTKLHWLDEALNKVLENAIFDEFPLVKNIEGLNLKQALDVAFAQAKKEVVEKNQPLYQYALHLDYLNQRNNIATFFLYSLQSTEKQTPSLIKARYLTVDLNKEKLLTLDDVFDTKGKLQDLRQALWNAYKVRFESAQVDLPINAENFYISDNFYFDKDGMHFIYNDLADISGGVNDEGIDLQIPWWSLVKSKYLPAEMAPSIQE